MTKASDLCLWYHAIIYVKKNLKKQANSQKHESPLFHCGGFHWIQILESIKEKIKYWLAWYDNKYKNNNCTCDNSNNDNLSLY